MIIIYIRFLLSVNILSLWPWYCHFTFCLTGSPVCLPSSVYLASTVVFSLKSDQFKAAVPSHDTLIVLSTESITLFICVHKHVCRSCFNTWLSCTEIRMMIAPNNSLRLLDPFGWWGELTGLSCVLTYFYISNDKLHIYFALKGLVSAYW